MSLRSRLILTHVFIILLTLLIVAVSLLFILHNFQNEIQLARLSDALVLLSVQARNLIQSNVPPQEVIARLEQQAEEVGHLLLITERGLVLVDPYYGLVNKNLGLAPARLADRQRAFLRGEYTTKDGRRILYAAVTAGQFRNQPIYLALASNEPSFLSMLDDIGPSLLIAGGVTLFVSLLVGWLLARSIAGPITRLTRATEALARGQYDHRVPAPSGDEMGRLAASFNTMAEQVQRARQMEKDFVANVSHELKTPITSIQGFAQAILDGTAQDAESARRAAQTIYAETSRMARLIGELLMLARLESGQMPLAREPIDLRDALPRWVERFQPRAQELGETLVTAIDGASLIVGDAGRLEQVVSNLVDNALKYNRAGGTVRVTAQKETPSKLRRRGGKSEGEWIALSVSDNGDGIPAEDLPRLFERFYRGDKARVAGGTGLGLAIAQEIVAAHGGKITVESDKGKGSTFIVHLPVDGRR